MFFFVFRNTKSLDMVLADLTNTVKLDTGAVRKMYTLEGTPVNSLLDLKDEEVFIAYGVDKCNTDDFDLDLIEFRNVQAILKSQKLDLKYEKFAHMSPKASRRKFLLSRIARSRRGTSKSRTNGLKNGNSFHNIEDLSDSYPSEVTDKYIVRQVRGHLNFVDCNFSLSVVMSFRRFKIKEYYARNLLNLIIVYRNIFFVPLLFGFRIFYLKNGFRTCPEGGAPRFM